MGNPKKGSGIKLWTALTLVMVMLLIVSVIGTNLALGAAPAINARLNTPTYKVVENDGNQDNRYVQSSYPNPEALEAARQEVAGAIAAEGTVLLVNNGVLPLTPGGAVYGDDPGLRTALEAAGFVVDSAADTAIVAITSGTGEELAMLEQAYDTVIVLVCGDISADCGFLFDYNVDAALWMGSADEWGFRAAADILAGHAEPSGRLADTWYFDDGTVAFPFGYGLSGTVFEWSGFGCTYNQGSDLFSLHVTVTNTGDAAGREVVQVYCQSPDGEEVLCGFGKTGLLEPGASANVTITVRGEALAAYGEKGALTAASHARAAAAFTYNYTVDPQRYTVTEAPQAQPAGMPVMGAENGLELAMFIGRGYDDPVWEDLLDQLTFEDMALLMADRNAAVPSVGKPATVVFDGTGTDLKGLAAAFNPKLAEGMGKMIGEDCLAKEISGFLAPDAVPCSADSFLAETVLDAVARGLRSRGVYIPESSAVPDGEPDDPAACRAMREECHRILYTAANSCAMNGISASGRIVQVMPWWQMALYGLSAACGLGIVACGTRLVFVMGKKPGKK